MSHKSSRFKATAHDVGEDAYELESHFILRLPNEEAEVVQSLLDKNELNEKLQINLDNDMRTATVKVDQRLLNARLFDMPCIIESLKTVDKKTFYKSADVSQILICKPEGEAFENVPDTEVDPKKKEKQYQWPHGVTPPLKNVRKRRFRKTLKKKYMDAPELEKELKRLLRADIEASVINWELVSIQEDGKQEKSTLQDSVEPTPEQQDDVAPVAENDEKVTINEDDIFGEISSSSSEVEDDTIVVADDFVGALECDDSNASEDNRNQMQQLQTDIFNCTRQKEHYEFQLVHLDNPFLKERLKEEVRLHEERLSELQQKLEMLRTTMSTR